jgi:LysM repeat protein/ABC-type branched-subunit amino acid transport system substrate-binding protein
VRILFLFILSCCFFIVLEAQEPGREQKVRENGKTYIMYTVKARETLYSIGRKFNVGLQQIADVNPEISNGLKMGQVLRIPVTEKPAPESVKNSGQQPSQFISHKIKRKETLYSISREYGISIENIQQFNPGVTKLRKGEILRIPQWKTGSDLKEKTEKIPDIQQEDFTPHEVQPGETLYAISRKYGQTVAAILAKNPGAEELKPGMRLLIPKGKVTDNQPEDKTPRECLPNPISYREKRTFKVKMLLPVMLAANKSMNEELILESSASGNELVVNQSDTLRSGMKMISLLQFQGNSENFIHFYEGALLAIDSLQQMGVNVDLEVLDTEQKASKVKNLVSSGALNDANLIIGPVYPNEQKEISDFAAKRKIPVVSPLSPSEEETKDNDYFFQVNPPREYISDVTNQYLVSAYRNSNIVVVQTSNSGDEAESLVSKLKKELGKNGGHSNSPMISLCNFRKDGLARLREMMVKDAKNVIVIPSVNEAEVSVVVSNMKNLAAEFDVCIVGNSRFPQFESIDPDYYHQGQLEFLTPYWPDMNQSVTRSFINKFRIYFKTDPNQYSIQGYDVTFYFTKALSDFGPDIRKCISNEKTSLVQGTYFFSKLPSGGYVNKGLSVVQYLPTYEIIRKKIIPD